MIKPPDVTLTPEQIRALLEVGVFFTKLDGKAICLVCRELPGQSDQAFIDQDLLTAHGRLVASLVGDPA